VSGISHSYQAKDINASFDGPGPYTHLPQHFKATFFQRNWVGRTYKHRYPKEALYKFPVILHYIPHIINKDKCLI